MFGMRTDRAQVLTFLAAGHETTSNTICWAIHYLAQSPNFQDRLRDEVLAMGDAPNMEYTTIESMRVLDNLYHEVLRVRSGGKAANRASPIPAPPPRTPAS